jgi:hypothetical protein|tara:strand:+ start:1029 stop:1259 length:231 start_codon:yes stop_codon:yes gene_type:complete
MHIEKSDLAWIATFREELNGFADELNSGKTTCDCCSLKKWDDFGQGVIGVTARSVAVKLAKLHSLMEDDIKDKSKV